jgi:phage terminase small subunit
MAKLAPKPEAFCRAYIETGNASQAYRDAGYKAGNDAAVAAGASRLLRGVKVQARIAELQSGHRKRHDITIDSLTQMLVEDRQLAHKEGEPNAAINAVLAMAKLHGLIVDRKNVAVDANHKHHHTTEPLSESSQWLAKLLGSGADSEISQSRPH